MALEKINASQVVTFDAAMTPGSARWLGELGQVNGLTYESTLPGGCSVMGCTLMCPPETRTDAIRRDRLALICRGAGVVWGGRLDKPAPSPAGWAISGHGTGTFGDDYRSVWTAWDQNNPIDAAIVRGLRWSKPSFSSAGLYLAQQQDSASQSVTEFLNMLTSASAYTWLADPLGRLSIIPIPVTPTRLLAVSGPVAEAIATDINTVWLRYQSAADNPTAGTSAVFSLTSAQNTAAATAHGPVETYADLSQATTISTAGGAQGVGNSLLGQYNPFSFTGPISVGPGELLNIGGAEIDLGCEQPGEVYQLVLSDFAWGGELTAGPLVFIGGGCKFHDDTEMLDLTPFQTRAADFSSLLSAAVAAATPPPTPVGG